MSRLNIAHARQAGVDSLFAISGFLMVPLLFAHRMLPLNQILMVLVLAFFGRYVMLQLRRPKAS